MADKTALVVASSKTSQQASGDSLVVGAGAKTASGASALFGSPGQMIATMIPAGTAETNSTTANQVAGRIAFDKADYVIGSLATTFRLVAVGNVSGSGLTFEVSLRDLTNAVTKDTLTTASTDPVRVAGAALDLATGLVVYEVRFRLVSGTGTASLGGAWIRVEQAF